MTTTNKVLIGLGVLALMVGTAVGASYYTRTTLQAENPPVQKQAHLVRRTQPMQNVVYQQAQQPVRPACDDRNIVGTVSGGLAGALIGNQFGKGSGKTLATVGGAAGGAYLGNEYIPTRGAACN